MISSAYWVESSTAFVLLAENWHQDELPPLELASEKHSLTRLRRAEPQRFGILSGYYQQGDQIHFILPKPKHGHLRLDERRLYVAGDFNGWAEAVNNEHWRLHPTVVDGCPCYRATVPAWEVLKNEVFKFKFVTGDMHWLGVNTIAPNAVLEHDGIINYELNPRCTGAHCFLFQIADHSAISGEHSLYWGEDKHRRTPIEPGLFFYDLKTDLPLGARIEKGKTIFRLFAPRAQRVSVEYFHDLKAKSSAHKWVELKRADDCTWEAVIRENLHGVYYYYCVEGLNNKTARFDTAMRILDPYALATVSERGPGIVWDHAQLPAKPEQPFSPPFWQDLVIMEAHVRDLIKHAPIDLSPEERLGFTGLAKWVRSEGNYLKNMGVNCVELQPVQQFDSKTREEYHWGYMTNNYFAPCAWYAQKPELGSQIAEFRDLVDAFHEQGIAVILDVVYNHVGEPAFLTYIDKDYYFALDKEGNLVNWSGCGNTTRAASAMCTHLIIESLKHFVEVFDVDGFRFDLAELLGVEVLAQIEHELKALKPGIITIAEPWSFRGHIASDLKHSGWAFWNDGYRDFLVDYMRGEGNQEGIRYFMSGSLWHLTSFPSQSINYVESHDDFCWIDRITEQANHNGCHPTHNDRARTHVMFAILMASVGVPMFSAGQDYLRSKQGNHNTYLMGDINALDYNRIHDNRSTHEYVKAWIRFRLSEAGALLRHFEKPGEHFYRFFGAHEMSAIATLINADFSCGGQRLLFAVNPHTEEARIHVEDNHSYNWQQLADAWNFDVEHGIHTDMFREHELILPPLSCGLWTEKKR